MMIVFIAYVKRKDEIPGQNFNKKWKTVETYMRENIKE